VVSSGESCTVGQGKIFIQKEILQLEELEEVKGN